MRLIQIPKRFGLSTRKHEAARGGTEAQENGKRFVPFVLLWLESARADVIHDNGADVFVCIGDALFGNVVLHSGDNIDEGDTIRLCWIGRTHVTRNNSV